MSYMSYEKTICKVLNGRVALLKFSFQFLKSFIREETRDQVQRDSQAYISSGYWRLIGDICDDMTRC